MRFQLIDRIVEIEPGVRIKAVKALTMAEEYLADHFPNFPVMPGVLMLEALTQASIWLVRISENFAHGMVGLKQANNIKYGRFVEPGQILTLDAQITGRAGREIKVKASGSVEDRTTVSARLVLECYNISDTDPTRMDIDESLRDHFRELCPVILSSPLSSSSFGGR